MNRDRSTVYRLMGAIFVSVWLTGCNKGNVGPQLDLTPVAGVITLDGKPLADADVAFYFEGAAPKGYYGSGAKTDEQGRYVLRTGTAQGAVAGNYKVTVSRLVGPNGGPVVVQEGLDIEQLKMQGQAKESLPEKYSVSEKTELKANVEKGKADGYDFALSSS